MYIHTVLSEINLYCEERTVSIIRASTMNLRAVYSSFRLFRYFSLFLNLVSGRGGEIAETSVSVCLWPSIIDWIVCRVFMKFGTGCRYKNLERKCEFLENRLGDSHPLHTGVQEFVTLRSIFIVRFGYNPLQQITTQCHLAVVGFVDVGAVKPVVCLTE